MEPDFLTRRGVDGKQVIGYRPATSSPRLSPASPLPALPGSVLQDLASRRPQGAGRPGRGCPVLRQSRAGGRGRGGGGKTRSKEQNNIWVTFKILFLDTEKYEVNKQTSVYTTAGLFKTSGRLSGKGTGLGRRSLCHTLSCSSSAPPWKVIPLLQAHGFPTLTWKTLSTRGLL